LSSLRTVGAGSGDLRDRVWSHGVNSLARLEHAKRAFAGIEVDLMFEGEPGTFHLRRPSGLTTGLTLEDLLEVSADCPELRLWLDWKNAEAASFEPALNRLRALDRAYRLRARCLVETSSDALFPELREVSESGFEHGYYLPTAVGLEVLATGSEAEALALAEAIEDRVEAVGATAITFDRRLEPFVRGPLQPLVSDRELARYAWDLDLRAHSAASAPEDALRYIAEDGLAALLLVFEPAPAVAAAD
jgi:hypothetical protein